MKRFTGAGRKALKDNNLYIALSLALTLPDICGSIEDPGPNKSQTRYTAWFDKWMSAEYCPNPDDKAKLTAQDCYQLRCSLIHSGSSDIAEKKIVDVATIQFFDNSMRAHLNYAGGNRLNGVLQPNVLQLNAEQFCNHMYDAVDKWDTEVASDSAIQREKSKLLTIHSAGPPWAASRSEKDRAQPKPVARRMG